MKISASSSYAAPKPSSVSQKQGKDDPFAAALGKAGVDPSNLFDILSQVEEATQGANSDSLTDTANPSAIRDAVNSVLVANGIDPAKVEQALAAGRPAGAPRGGPPPGGKPPGGPPPGESSSGGSIASALQSANVDQGNLDSLLEQLLDAVKSSTGKSNGSSADSIQAAVRKVLDANGVDTQLFESAFQGQLGSSGNFLNVEA